MIDGLDYLSTPEDPPHATQHQDSAVEKSDGKAVDPKNSEDIGLGDGVLVVVPSEVLLLLEGEVAGKTYEVVT